MFKRFLRPVLTAAAVSLASQVATAGVINVEVYGNKYKGYNGASETGSLGGYDMTTFDELGLALSNVSEIESPVDSQLLLVSDRNDDPVKLRHANSTDWWANLNSDNSIGDDYNIYTTNTNMIEILLPENTLAFAFNVGASFRGSAWFNAYDQDGNLDYQSNNFRVGGPRDLGYLTPGFGLYADNSNYVDGGACNYISRIVVDPSEGWGVGNFSIAQDTNNSCSTVSVSEPGSLALFCFGLLGLAAARAKQA